MLKSPVLLAFLIAVTSQACVMGPNNGTKLCNYNQVIHFSGYADKPGQVVTIKEWNGSSWVAFATAIASTSAQAYADSPSGYSWQVDGRANTWTYRRGEFYFNSYWAARFRFEQPGGNTMAVADADNDWLTCFSRQPSSSSFIEKALACRSQSSPVVELLYKPYDPAGCI